jgi:hypothetical protein
MKQKIEPKSISATLVDLAVRGFIKIREVKKGVIYKSTDYELIKLKDFDNPQEDLRGYERILLKIIFTPRTDTSGQKIAFLSSIKKKHSFSKIVEQINSNFSYSFCPKYFANDPLKINENWFSIGTVLFIIVEFLFVLICLLFLFAF